MRTRIIAVLMLVFFMASISFAQAVDNKKPFAVSIKDWSVRLSIPQPCEEHPGLDTSGYEFSKAYTSGGFIYLVKISKVDKDLLSDTAIEQMIQFNFSVASKLGDAERCEHNARSGGFFKGYNGQIQFDDAALKSAPYIKDILKGDSGCCSSLLTSVKNDSAILVLDVIGPKDQKDNVRIAAIALAESLKQIKDAPKPAQADAGHGQYEDASSDQAKPDNSVKPAQDSQAGNKPRTSARPPAKRAKPKPIVLKKDQIQLSGKIDSIAADGKSLTLIVDQIRMLGTKPVTLNPTRSKLVIIEEMPEGAAVGSRLIVVGKNEGVGKPIKPDLIQPAQPKLGK